MAIRTRIILKNTGFNVAGMGATSLIALALTPYLLRHLGGDLFGVWALLGIFITGSQMLDFGLGRALVRNVAQLRALGRWSTIGTNINSLLWPLLATATVSTILVFWSAPLLIQVLAVPPRSRVLRYRRCACSRSASRSW